MMKRIRWSMTAVAFAIALIPIQAASASAPLDPPDRIDLPNGWQPEGITSHGRFLYVGSLADGAIWRGDSRTGSGRVLAEGDKGRVTVGVDFDRCRADLLWAAGGGTKEVRAYNANTGKLLRTYEFPSATDRFFNDLVVTPRAVFVTDSTNQELAVLPFRQDDARDADGCDTDAGLPRTKDVYTLPLTGDLEYGDGFNLNGIVRSGGVLIAVQSNTGELFTINRNTGTTKKIDTGDYVFTNGDGLEIHRHTLYVVRNQSNLIAVVDLARNLESGKVVAELTSDDFDVPTTVALTRHSLWAVNARFGTDPTPDTPYWITRLDEYRG
jgi:hypothetical protein